MTIVGYAAGNLTFDAPPSETVEHGCLSSAGRSHEGNDISHIGLETDILQQALAGCIPRSNLDGYVLHMNVHGSRQRAGKLLSQLLNFRQLDPDWEVNG